MAFDFDIFFGCKNCKNVLHYWYTWVAYTEQVYFLSSFVGYNRVIEFQDAF